MACGRGGFERPLPPRVGTPCRKLHMSPRSKDSGFKATENSGLNVCLLGMNLDHCLKYKIWSENPRCTNTELGAGPQDS